MIIVTVIVYTVNRPVLCGQRFGAVGRGHGWGLPSA